MKHEMGLWSWCFPPLLTIFQLYWNEMLSGHIINPDLPDAETNLRTSRIMASVVQNRP